MQKLPHHYVVTANGESQGNVALSSQGLTPIDSAAPAEFGGPGDQWSPETLLVAAIADCYILSFRAISRASNLDWATLSCEVTGVLDRVDGVTQFTEIELQAVLDLPPDGDESIAIRLLEKAKKSCLITNSMTSTISLETTVCIA